MSTPVHSNAYRAARILLLQIYTATAASPASDVASRLRRAALAVPVGLLEGDPSGTGDRDIEHMANALTGFGLALQDARESGLLTRDQAELLEAQKRRVVEAIGAHPEPAQRAILSGG